VSEVRRNPERVLRAPGAHRNPIVARGGREWVVSACSFDFVFEDADEIAVYLRWFERYATAHRRQRDVIDRPDFVRDRLAKLPARLFKTGNRPKVIRALREALAATRHSRGT
jgi:hypothetical protein